MLTTHRTPVVFEYGLCRAAEAIENRGEIVVRNPKLDEREAPKSFTFDAVFGEGCTQKQVSESL